MVIGVLSILRYVRIPVRDEGTDCFIVWNVGAKGKFSGGFDIAAFGVLQGGKGRPH